MFASHARSEWRSGERTERQRVAHAALLDGGLKIGTEQARSFCDDGLAMLKGNILCLGR